jgi:uncharacterized membrane protein
MTALIVILLLILIGVLYTTLNNLKQVVESLHTKVDILMRTLERPPTDTVQNTAIVDAPKPNASLAPKPNPIPIPEPPQAKPSLEVPVQKETLTPTFSDTDDINPSLTPAPKRPSFFERNPDLEKFIGENVANKIGIAVLVIGIGFFVKYAIDQDWINEIGRVALGIACGGGLIAIAHRLRNSLPAFSAVLIGGGIAVLYLTITIAFQLYHIFPAAVAFMLMIVITGFAVIFSLLYNRMELAILAILGGFSSPFMVSTGEGNYIILFTYIAVLDIGMLVLAYYKRWTAVNAIAYLLTWLLFIGWRVKEGMLEDQTVLWHAFLFAFIFYTLFFLMSIINHWKNGIKFNALEIGILLSNTFVFYAQGMLLLHTPTTTMYQGLFTFSLAIVNFVFVYGLYKQENIDKNLVYLLIGLVLTFVSLAAPVQLEGNFITLFWAAESVLLLWLAQKSGIQLMRYTSLLISMLMLISLLIDYTQVYEDNTPLAILFNKAYITSIVVILAAGGCYSLWKKDKETFISADIPVVYLSVAGVLFYLAHLLELRHHLLYHDVFQSSRFIILGCWTMMCLATLQWLWARKITKAFPKVVIVITGIMALFYLGFYNRQIVLARDAYVIGIASSVGFIFHFVLVTFVGIIWYQGLRTMQTFTAFNRSSHHLYSWIFIGFLLFLLSAELNNVTVLVASPTTESLNYLLEQTSKIGFPILWGLASFLIIYIGLRKKKKHLRVISLTLFLITLLKLFLLDLRGISEGGKIAAFISLGVLLLIISFMYQRLKKVLLMEDEALTHKPTTSHD